ncbi:hypothetical protein [Calothrix sp. NIES-3974]|uniref:hypothetical protein n=1 Tax=Calothrix sp. NIES-3974 TaxID=2005462 RepID=UPI0012FDD51D|nr:hypothetical protein [Calothrix sp. NIES-3974]
MTLKNGKIEIVNTPKTVIVEKRSQYPPPPMRKAIALSPKAAKTLIVNKRAIAIPLTTNEKSDRTIFNTKKSKVKTRYIASLYFIRD